MRNNNQEYNFCTLFDSHYLIRGMALYESMKKTGEQFCLYIFALDKTCENILHSLSLEKVVVIGLDEFENDELKDIKKNRSIAEFCWTCTSYSIDYVFSNYSVQEITYLDADLYFFDKPSVLINEFRNSGKDVLLMEHRYTPDFLYKEGLYGKYNVEFMTFCRTDNGMRILSWWKERCYEWCYARIEEGKFGDQKYLDFFEEIFSGTYVCKNIGGGVAPWNVSQYNVSINKNTFKPLVDGKQVIFYHFHELYWGGREDIDMGHGYGELSDMVFNYIYEPYINALETAVLCIKKINPDFEYVYDLKKTDYVCAFDDEILDSNSVVTIFRQLNPNVKPIYIWGAGENGKRILKFLNRHHIAIEGIVDTYKKGETIDSTLVFDIECIKKNECFVIVSPSNYRDPIIHHLIKLGYKPKTGFITYEDLEKEINNEINEVNESIKSHI